MEFQNREGGFYLAKRLPIIAKIVIVKFKALLLKSKVLKLPKLYIRHLS